MRFLRLVAVVLLLVAAPLRSQAEDGASPEALQAANDLFKILSVDMMTQLTAQITSAFWPLIEEKARAGKIDDATLADLRKAFEDIQLAFLTDAMKQAPAVYARHFTAAELRELTAFYRSPTGAKALHEMPQVTGEFMALLMPRMQDLERQTGEAFDKVLRAHGYTK
jgi:hypothetical protein